MTSSTRRVRKLIAPIVPMLMLCSGCAFGHRVVALNYSPSAGASNDGNAQAIHVSAIRDVCPNNEVTVFAQGREIGEIRNGWYVKTACVVSQSMDLSPWITDALAKELKEHGFEPVQVTSLPPECPLGLSGSLSECYSKMKFFGGQTCTLKATFSIHKNGATLSTKQYIAQHNGGLGLGLTAGDYEKIFQAAMADLMTKIVADVVANSQ